MSAKFKRHRDEICSLCAASAQLTLCSGYGEPERFRCRLCYTLLNVTTRPKDPVTQIELVRAVRFILKQLGKPVP